MIIFDNEEAEYLRWVEAHQDGYVINAEKRAAGYHPYMLHRASCASVKSDNRGNYTTLGYAKFCSMNRDELVRRGEQMSGSVSICSQCKP